jgi:hypothetical protein
MFQDTVKITGKLDIYTYHESDLLTPINHLEIPNLVVTTGKQFIASRISSTPAAQISHMAIGGNPAPPATLASDTTLATEIARVALTNPGGTASSNTIQFSATFPAGTGTSATVSEAGLFNASSAGTMLARTTFTAQNKTAAMIITIVWTITIS